MLCATIHFVTEDTITLPEFVIDLCNEVCEYSDEVDRKSESASAEQLATMLDEYVVWYDEMHQRIRDMTRDLVVKADVPASVILTLEDGLRIKLACIDSLLNQTLERKKHA